MSAKTRLGLPLVRDTTYRACREAIRCLQTVEEVMRFYEALAARVTNADPLYVALADRTAQQYPPEDRGVIKAELLTGYDLLLGEGEVPKLRRDCVEKRWDATMASRNQMRFMLNLGVNMDRIDHDNPVYGTFIWGALRFFKENRDAVFSDLSCSYMFLADAAQAR